MRQVRAEARALQPHRSRVRAVIEGPGGEKQHQGHEDVQQIGLDDQVGIIEHQEGDDPEKEPGEMGVQAFLDLHDRDGGAGQGAAGARRPVASWGLSAQSGLLNTAAR